MDEAGYYLTTLEAAVAFIERLTVHQLKQQKRYASVHSALSVAIQLLPSRQNGAVEGVQGCRDTGMGSK